MKRLLLDTHVFLWWLIDDQMLGEKARLAIGDGRNEIYISAATIWEISIKKALGEIEAPDDLERVVQDEGFRSLPISLYHAESVARLPLLHRDPFDRMLIAQAQADGLILMTADEQIPPYGVQTARAKN